MVSILLLPRSSAAQDEKPATSGHVFIEGDAREPVLQLQKGILGALGYLQSIQWKAPDLSLPKPDKAAVDGTREMLTKARDLGREGEIEQGLEVLQEAIRILDDNIYTLSTATPKAIGRYINVLRRLAVFLFTSGNEEATRDVLRRLFALHPEIEFKRFTKALRPMFTRMQKEHNAEGYTTLKITTEPPGATVYFNFELQGPSPVEVSDVPAGPAIILAVHPGYEPTVARPGIKPVEEGVTQHVTLTPGRIMSLLLPTQPEMVSETMGADSVAVAEFLQVDLLALFDIRVIGPRESEITGVLLDRRLKTRLKVIKKTVDPEKITPEQVRTFAHSLFEGVRLDGKVETTKKPPPKEKQPGFMSGLWKSVKSAPQKEYFWPVVGGVGGALVVGAVVTAILLSGENTDEFRRTNGSRTVLGF